MKPWKRIDPTVVKKAGWRTVVLKTFIKPDGGKVEFTTVNEEHTHCAGVVALTKDNEVIVAKQFRVGPEKLMNEIPGGVVEDHETDFKKAALRELKEETGYVPGTVMFLGDVYKDGYNNTTWHYFFAEDCEPHADGQKLDDNEHIEVGLISIDKFIGNAKNAEMTDAQAVFLAYEKLMDKQGGK